MQLLTRNLTRIIENDQLSKINKHGLQIQKKYQNYNMEQWKYGENYCNLYLI